jgi:sulfite exporter TauE/SafE/copper chaperone CopZ
MEKLELFVSGLHCKACVGLVEQTILEQKNISSVKVNLIEEKVFLEGNFVSSDPKIIADELNILLKPNGYSLSTREEIKKNTSKDFLGATLITLGFLGLFFLLQKLGIINLVDNSNISFSTSFLIGLIASISTCMAVVGGLVLSISANFAKGGSSNKPQIFFHLGRLISFFILGGLLGSLGSFFQIGGSWLINFLVALIMLVLGLNLLDIFPWAKKLQLSLPSSFSQKINKFKEINNSFTPLMLGLLTFFLPCGFTQSMQIFSLSSGSFWTGSLTMFFFALGTLPILGLLSFASTNFSHKINSSLFFKTAGLIVISFALLNLWNALAAAGLVPILLIF